MRIRRRDLPGEVLVPPAGRQPGDVEALLDRDRHAEQRLVLARCLAVKRARRIAGAFEIAHHDGIDLAIASFDPRDRGIDRLER